MRLKHLPYIFILLLVTIRALGQDEWKLEKDYNGIKVFTRKLLKWKSIKESKTELYVKGTPEDVIKHFRDISNHKNWMHRVAQSELVEMKNINEFTVYYVATAPWPIADRDIVAHYVIKKDAEGNYLIIGDARPDLVPVQPGKIRVPKMSATWEISAQKNGTTKIVYYSATDPGGALPEWLANTAVTDAPFETVSSLKALIEK
jgi:hypothetical protein